MKDLLEGKVLQIIPQDQPESFVRLVDTMPRLVSDDITTGDFAVVQAARKRQGRRQTQSRRIGIPGQTQTDRTHLMIIDTDYIADLASKIKDLEDQVARLKEKNSDIEKDCAQQIFDENRRCQKEIEFVLYKCERDVEKAREWAKEILESVKQKYGRRAAESLALDAKIRAS